MVKAKSPWNTHFLLLILFPCVLSGAMAEFGRDIRKIDSYSSAVSDGETSESCGTMLLISENLLLCNQPLAQNKVRLGKFWRQLLSLIVFALFLKAFSRVTLQKYYLHNYFPQKIFHLLVLSLLLGGRAPPRSA
jgi:hypothetical protein